MMSNTLQRVLRKCCAPGCRVEIEPSRLACDKHWRQLSPLLRREWVQAWGDVARGVDATVPERRREEFKARLIGRLSTARRRAVQRLRENSSSEYEPSESTHIEQAK